MRTQAVKLDDTERFLKVLKELRDAVNRCATALEALSLPQRYIIADDLYSRMHDESPTA